MAAPSRRQFLGLVLGAGAALAGTDAQAYQRRRRERIAVYRLSTHSQRVCGACKAHGANRYFRTRAAADADRAHPGCNCPIVVQRLHPRLVAKYFANGDVFDRRWRRWKLQSHS